MRPEVENCVQPKDTPLFELVFQRIQKSPTRSIPFSDYMEMALYDENHGYYARPGERKVGRQGDFYTSVSVGEMFGFLLARKVMAARRTSFDPGAPFVIVEQGAHDGQLALDVLTALREAGETGFEYRIVDPREGTRASLTERLAGAGFSDVFRAVETLGEAKAPQGIFLSNELLDAFPFRRLIFDGKSWAELQVALDGGNLCWAPRPLESALEPFTKELGNAFSPGYTTEVCPAMNDWISDASLLFERGLWWIIDYGYESEDYFAPHRKDGTWRCYRNHVASEDPFSFPGEVDITAHVNFTHLREAAEAAGLTWKSFSDQHHFLIEAARDWLLEIEGQTPDAAVAKKLRQFQTLSHPGMMGTRFKLAELSRSI